MTFIETSNVPAAFRAPVTFWTDERIETLKTLWRAGHTASYIAGEFGGITRSAVIGKVHRLNLETRRITVRMPDLNHYRPHQRVRFRSIKPKPAVEPERLLGEPTPRGVYSVADLAKNDCRWPYGDPSQPGFHFCGAEKLNGRSYCGPHHRLAYQPKR